MWLQDQEAEFLEHVMVEAAVQSLGERGQSVRGDPERLEALEVSDGVGETRQSVPRDPERRQVEEAADALG